MKIITELEADNAEEIIGALKDIKGISSVIAEENVDVAELGEMGKIKKLWSDIELLRKIEREMYPFSTPSVTYKGGRNSDMLDMEYKIFEKIKEVLRESKEEK